MKATGRIEEVEKGDRINGKPVVEVLHRFDVMTREHYARLVLAGGWPIVDGYFGKLVEVER
jgi:hypothetical protein